MEKNTNDDSTDTEYVKEIKFDQDATQIKMELSDIMLPPSSPPKPPNNVSEISSCNTQVRDYPQKRKNSPVEEPDSKKLCEDITYEVNDDSSSEAEEYFIDITDAHNNFQIRNYIDEGELIGDVVITRNENNHVRLKFENAEDCHKIEQRLNTDRLKGNKFSFKSSRQDAELTDNASDTTEIVQQCSWNSNEDTEYEDPLGLFGLKVEYLRSLDIIPPLDRWVHVTNFRCDKFELRDVMELAGRVLSCSVMNISRRFAKVQYSHPLEAVQAISMLNGQMYFGLKLCVCLERNPRNDIILPKGLVNIGLGLGLLGRPIRDIASQYKNYTRKQNSTINPVLFRKLDSDDSKEDMHKLDEVQIDFKEFINSTKRSFDVKHVEDLDHADGLQSEKDIPKGFSPESISIKSVDSPVSCHEVKDVEKSHDINKIYNYSKSVGRNLPDVPGSTIPIRLRRASPAAGFPRPIVTQNIRPQPLHSTSFRPGSSGQTAVMSSGQYPGQFRPSSVNSMSEVRPNPAAHPMSNPIGNPPTPGPFGLCQPFRPLTPTGPSPVNNPGPVYGLTSMYSPGAVSGPPLGIGHRPGPMHGPRPFTGPNPVQSSGLVHGPGPIQGQGPVQTTGSMQVPGHGNNPVPLTSSVAGANPVVPPGNKVDVEFANLPPSTTFPFLCEKLSQCGQVISLKFTTPGCAVATFGHTSHAERCFQNYNGMIVEGYRIVVKLV